MAKDLVLSFIAADRPGLVEMLSDTVAEQGGNWLESRMANLAEKFAGVARVEVPADKVDGLRKALHALEAQGFHITVEEASDDAPASGAAFTIELVGPDQPGILREISGCLARLGVSVEELTTELRDAPMGGGSLFHAEAEVSAPTDLEADDLRDALEAIGGALMVDLTLRETA